MTPLTPFVKTCVTVAFTLSAFSFLLQGFTTYMNSRNVDPEYIAAEVAKEYQKTLPVQIDEITRLEAVEANGPMLIMSYEFPDLVERDVSSAERAEFLSEMRAGQRQYFCKSEAYRDIFKAGVEMHFEYRGLYGEVFSSFSINRCT